MIVSQSFENGPINNGQQNLLVLASLSLWAFIDVFIS
jgi:hypothetical protein